MEQGNQEQQLIRRYLLGESDAEELRQVEERILLDNDFFEELLITEEELIDQSLGGSLSAGEQEKFKRHFLQTAERQQKLRFARAFRKYLTTGENPEPVVVVSQTNKTTFWHRIFPANFRALHPALTFSLAATLLLCVAGLSWLVIKNRARTNQQANVTLTVTLIPGAFRDPAPSNNFVLPANFNQVQLTLKTAADSSQTYRAVLQTAEGQEVFTADKLQVEIVDGEKAIIFNVPANALTTGDYRLHLSSFSQDGSLQNSVTYYFRVLKK